MMGYAADAALCRYVFFKLGGVSTGLDMTRPLVGDAHRSKDPQIECLHEDKACIGILKASCHHELNGAHLRQNKETKWLTNACT